MKKRSCADQLFTVRQLGEKKIEKKRMLMVWVDLEKACDRVDREMLSVGDIWGWKETG